MKSLIQYARNPWFAIDALTRTFSFFLPDKLYLSILYRCRIGKNINWENPTSFTEKIQWLKINNRKPEQIQMVDKARVKDYVAKMVGEEYVIPTIGIWNNYDDIDFDKLPNTFVLKTTHGGGGGGIDICYDKRHYSIEEGHEKFELSLKSDIYHTYREWPYRDVPRRIIAEELIQMKDGGDLKDYKFFCFNGVPLFFKVDYDRFTNHHANYYDLEWNLLPFGEEALPPLQNHIEEPPLNFTKMVEIATKLSEGHPFLRVDLYNVSGKIYFGELTFFPASGLGKFTSSEWDDKLGALIKLG